MHGCMMLLINALNIYKNTKYAKPSLDTLSGISYLHMLLHELSISDSPLFISLCVLKFAEYFMKVN